MDFQAPHFSFWNTAYTAVGAIGYWGLKGRTKLRVYTLSDLIERLNWSDRACYVTEFLVFIVLGCFVGVGVVEPTNPRQAITAGLAWTGVFATQRSQGRPKTR